MTAWGGSESLDRRRELGLAMRLRVSESESLDQWRMIGPTVRGWVVGPAVRFKASEIESGELK